MARDAITGARNRWSELFAVGRKSLAAALPSMRENKEFPVQMLFDRLTRLSENAVAILPGCSSLIRQNGKRIAYRDDEGTLHTLNSVCPHLGCVVLWNDVENTRDCPCHGSRFTSKGDLIAGPAEKGLDPV